MQTTLLGPQHLEQAKALWRMCFPEDPEAFIRLYFGARIEMDNAIGVLEDGDISAILHMIPYSLKVRGKDVFAPYVVGAGTHSAQRKRGLMGELLVSALAEMRRRGAALCPLHPFRYGYYRRFGWETVSARARLDIGAEALIAAFGSAAEAAEQTDIDAGGMQRVFTQFCARFGAYMRRDEAECAQRLAETRLSGDGVMLQADGEEAYALFECENGVLTAHELSYTHICAMHALLGVLARRDGVTRVRVPLPSGDALPEALQDIKGSVYLEPFLMARIVDVEALLPGMDALSEDSALLLGVHDAQCPWNDAVFAMETQNGRIAAVNRTREAPMAQISAEGLAQWVCGYTTASKAQRNGVLRVASGAAVRWAEAVRTPYFQEMY